MLASYTSTKSWQAEILAEGLQPALSPSSYTYNIIMHSAVVVIVYNN